MKNFSTLRKKIALLQFFLVLTTAVEGQMPSVKAVAPTAAPLQGAGEGFSWFYYLVLFGLIAALGGVVTWTLKTKKLQKERLEKARLKGDKDNWDTDAVDADKELEWFRKNKKAMGNKTGNYPQNLPKSSKIPAKKKPAEPVFEQVEIDKTELKEKLEKNQYQLFPVNGFLELKFSKPYQPLQLSSDTDLMSAVEQVQDELEEDEEVRSLALRILSAFKTKNSVESLTQIALYDVSANLRSRAAATLADFDHESVFEAVLLACADPSREVRAAAARGLFRLNFDRADAWTRIVETNDEFRIQQAVRAAVEADLVERSFDRLIHEDLKIAYEAFAFTMLVIKSGITEKIFKTLENHQDNNVKTALLHVLAVAKDETMLPNLFDLLDNPQVGLEIKEKADELIKSFELVPA